MLKKIFVLGFIVSSLVFFNSCANKNDSEKIVLRYSAPGFEQYDKIRAGIGKDFEKLNPGVKMVYEGVNGQGFFEKILVQIAGNSEPDVYFMRDFELDDFSSRGVLLPLNDLIKNDPDFKLDDFYTILIDSYSDKGNIYGLPGSFTTGVIYYNKNILDRKGLKAPLDLSWKNIVDLGFKIQEKTGEQVSLFPLVLEYNDWLTFIFQNGGKLFSDDKKRCIINSPQSIEAITYVKELINRYRFVPNSSDLQMSEAYQLFMMERCALFTGGRWYSTSFKAIKNFEWGVMPHLYGKKKMTRLDSHAWVISKRTKHPEMAWKFLKYLTSSEVNAKMVEIGDSVPTHKSDIDKFVKENPENRVFIDSIAYSYSLKNMMSPYIPWNRVNSVIKDQMDLFLMDKQDAVTSLRNVENFINKIIEEK